MDKKDKDWFDRELDALVEPITVVRESGELKDYKEVLFSLETLVFEYVIYLCNLSSKDYGKEFKNPAMKKPKCFTCEWNNDYKALVYPIVEKHQLELIEMCRYAFRSFNPEIQVFHKYIYSSIVQTLRRNCIEHKGAGLADDVFMTKIPGPAERFFDSVIDFAEDRGISVTSLDGLKKLQTSFEISKEEWKDLQLYIANGRNFIGSTFVETSNEDDVLEERNLADEQPDYKYLGPYEYVAKREKLQQWWKTLESVKDYSSFEKAVLTHYFLYKSDFDEDVMETIQKSKIVSPAEFKECCYGDFDISDLNNIRPIYRSQERVCKDYGYKNKSSYLKVIERICDKSIRARNIFKFIQ